jgi:hypothetical protein
VPAQSCRQLTTMVGLASLMGFPREIRRNERHSAFASTAKGRPQHCRREPAERAKLPLAELLDDGISQVTGQYAGDQA